MHGPDEMRAYFAGYVAAFPDGRNKLVSSIESPERCRLSASPTWHSRTLTEWVYTSRDGLVERD
jgi:hypothetical protein